MWEWQNELELIDAIMQSLTDLKKQDTQKNDNNQTSNKSNGNTPQPIPLGISPQQSDYTNQQSQ